MSQLPTTQLGRALLLALLAARPALAADAHRLGLGDDGASSGRAAPLASLPPAGVPPGLVAIPAIPANMGESSAPLPPRMMLRLGGLERSGAALAALLELYRAALTELVPALHVTVACGSRPEARASWTVPAAAQATFTTWAEQLAAAPRPAGLPALAGVFHDSLVDILTEVAQARQLGRLLAPSQALAVAFAQQANLAGDVLAVLGAQRALGVYNVDDSQVAAEAARTAAALRQRLLHLAGRPLSEQDLASLQSALDARLDAAAFAAASGASTAERLGSSYLPLLQAVRNVNAHMAEYSRSMTTMATPPPPAAFDLRAELREADASGRVQAALAWTPPSRGRQGIASLRVVRRIDVPVARQRLADAAACGALATEAAGTALADLLAHEAPEIVAEIGGDASAYREELTDTRRDWPLLYKVVASSAFGVEAHAHEVAATPAFATLQPVRHVEAAALAPRYDDRRFYRLADAVEVRWQPSASALDEHAPADAARVRGYDVYRLDAAAVDRASASDPALAPLVAPPAPAEGEVPLAEQAPEGWLRVGYVDAGQHSFVDRVPLVELGQGVAYVVVAVAADGSEARAAGGCSRGPSVRLDLTDAWRLARAGAARLPKPTARERAFADKLAEPAALAEALAMFAARPEAQRQASWQQYWQRLPEAERQALHEKWPTYLSAAERAVITADVPPDLASGLQFWVTLHGFLHEQPQLRQKAAQYWQMLAAEERQDAWHSFRHSFGPLLVADGNALKAASRAATGGRATAVAAAATPPVPQELMSWAFWQSRDQEDQEALQQWWQAATPEQQRARLQAFWHDLAPEGRLALAWPPLALLTAEERAERMTRPPWPVPQAFLPAFLAFVAYDDLAVSDKEAAVAAEAGVWRRGIEALHYGIRPLDVWMDFKLPLVSVLVAMGVLAGWLMQYAAREQD